MVNKDNLLVADPVFQFYRNPELSESDSMNSGEPVASRESTEVEMRQDGIEKPKGIYCKRCGYYWEDWDRFFQHHKTKHPWMDPEVLKAAIEEGHKYVAQWRKMIGYAGNWQV